jgi:hypothetical protein
MKRVKGRRPSGGMIVAAAALVIALAGTAIAGPSAITSALSKSEKKQTKKIAKNQVNKLAPGLSVGNSDKLDQLDSKQVSPATGINDPDDVALTDNFATVTSVTIAVTGNSRLLANASVHLDSDGGGNDRGDCRFTIAGTPITGFSMDVPTNDTTMPVTATQTVGPGTHVVTLDCLKNVAGVITVRQANVTVSAHLEG